MLRLNARAPRRKKIGISKRDIARRARMPMRDGPVEAACGARETATYSTSEKNRKSRISLERSLFEKKRIERSAAAAAPGRVPALVVRR